MELISKICLFWSQIVLEPKGSIFSFGYIQFKMHSPSGYYILYHLSKFASFFFIYNTWVSQLICFLFSWWETTIDMCNVKAWKSNIREVWLDSFIKRMCVTTTVQWFTVVTYLLFTDGFCFKCTNSFHPYGFVFRISSQSHNI